MFRGMRRKAQLLSEEETIKIFEKGTSGVLAVLGDEDYPYAVPLSYIYCDSKIYFHGSKSGHMLDSILKHEKVSFCVIDEDKVVPEEYTTYFRSAIAFGKVRVIDNENEKRNAIEKLAVRYTPNDEEGRLKKIEREYKILCMFELDIEHMTGKEAMKLVKEKKKK